LIEDARKYADYVQIGRTHGQHAIPITFGFALANYVSRLGGRIEKITNDTNNLRGKFSGAVGSYNALSLFDSKDPAILEIQFLSKLGLKPSDTNISTQVVEPEPVTDLVYSIISCFSILANISDDMRNLIRTEIGEVVGKIGDDIVGSSTMPHKVNPKDFENIKSMWKEFAPRMTTRFMDQISEHQRDLTNSASSRFVIEVFVAFDCSIRRMIHALKQVHVDQNRMRKNLGTTKGSIVAEPLYILLALKGYPEAYEYVRGLVRLARKTGVPLVELIWEQKELQPILDDLSDVEVQILKNPGEYLGAAYQRTIATCDYWERKTLLLQKLYVK
jgi:adenylosuccinate lyase